VQSAPPVAVINERMAQSFWPGMTNLLGQRILLNGSPVEYDIVGVVENARLWPKQEPPPQIYLPQAQFWQPTYNDISMSLRLELWFVVRSGPNPAALDVIVGNAIREMDAGVVVDKVQPMAAVVSQAFGPWRSTMLLLGLFAGLAVMLSAIGIYGVISYAVTQRKHEIGIRMALGAGRSEVLRMMMQGALRLTFGGIAIGVVASYWTTRLIASQLFDVAPTDPVTYAAVVVALLGVAVLACYVPARRAARFDPAVALRSE
jgi:putative ABC transport system permease protein